MTNQEPEETSATPGGPDPAAAGSSRLVNHRMEGLRRAIAQLPEEYRRLLAPEIDALAEVLAGPSASPGPRASPDPSAPPGPDIMASLLAAAEMQGRSAGLLNDREAAERAQVTGGAPFSGAPPEGLWVWDLSTGAVGHNEVYASQYGNRPSGQAGMDWWIERVHPQDRERVQGSFGEAVASQTEYWVCEYRFRAADGSYADVFERVLIWRGAQGAAVRVAGAIHDLTRLKQSQEAQAQVEMQRFLMQHREIERQRIARELHDGPIQDVIGMVFQIQLLGDYVAAREGHEIMQQLNASMKELVNNLRRMTNELRPPALARFGLKKAIQIHADEFRGRYSSPRLALDLDDDGEALSEEVRLGLYRVYQESLDNVLRHAEATHVLVRLSVTEEGVTLSIEDDGKGFCPPTGWLDLARVSKFGLVGMKERAEAMQGKLAIDSEPGKGTRVTVRLGRPFI